jgi:hypothetical protein
MAGIGEFLSNLGKPSTPAAPQAAIPVAPAPQASPVSSPIDDATNEGAGAPTSEAVLSDFAKMFTAETPKQEGGDAPVDLFAINQDQLAKAAGTINMNGVVSPELVTKALGGDTASFMEVINKVSQMTFMMAHQAAMSAVKPAVDAEMQSFSKKMPTKFNEMSLDATLQSDPLMSNPALKPVVDSLRTQIMSKHPDATPQQVQKAISEYMKASGITLAPQGKDAKKTKETQGGVNWDNFL